MNKRFLSILSIVLSCFFLSSCGEQTTQDSVQTIESTSNVDSDASYPDENTVSEDVSFQTVSFAESYDDDGKNPFYLRGTKPQMICSDTQRVSALQKAFEHALFPAENNISPNASDPDTLKTGYAVSSVITSETSRYLSIKMDYCYYTNTGSSVYPRKALLYDIKKNQAVELQQLITESKELLAYLIQYETDLEDNLKSELSNVAFDNIETTQQYVSYTWYIEAQQLIFEFLPSDWGGGNGGENIQLRIPLKKLGAFLTDYGRELLGIENDSSQSLALPETRYDYCKYLAENNDCRFTNMRSGPGSVDRSGIPFA